MPSQIVDNLPQELISTILTHLHDDTPSLTQCALVSTAFLPASRHHLFHCVTLGETGRGFKESSDLLTLLTSSTHLVNYIKELRIVNHTNWIEKAPSLPPLMNALHLLTHFSLPRTPASTYANGSSTGLVLTSSTRWDYLTRAMQQAIEGVLHLPTLEYVELAWIRGLPPVSRFVTWLSSPRLKELRLYNLLGFQVESEVDAGCARGMQPNTSPPASLVSPAPAPAPTPTPIPSARTLRTLATKGPEPTGLVETYVRLGANKLENLSLSIDNPRTALARWCLINRNTGLRTLQVSFSAQYTEAIHQLQRTSDGVRVSPLDLSKHPNLTHITISLALSRCHCLQLAECLSWFTTSLSSLPSSFISVHSDVTLTLRLGYWHSRTEDLVNFLGPVGEWIELDRVLSSRSGLGTFTVVFMFPPFSKHIPNGEYAYKHASFLTERVAGWLPTLGGEGRVRIELVP